MTTTARAALIADVKAICEASIQHDAKPAPPADIMVIVRYPGYTRPAVIRLSRGCHVRFVAKWLDELHAPCNRVSRKIKCAVCGRAVSVGGGMWNHQQAHSRREMQ